MQNQILRVLTSLSLAAACGAQSPWTRDAGSGYVQFAAYRIGPYDDLFQRSGDDLRTSREITETSFELYGEYGVTDNWTVLATVPFRGLEADDPIDGGAPSTAAGTLDALGNVRLGTRHRLFEDGFIVSGQVEVDLPTGRYDSATGLRTGRDALTFLPRVSIGAGNDRFYGFGHAGVGLATNSYSSDWRIGAEAGVRPFGDLWVSGVVDVVQSFRNGSVTLPTANLETGLFVDEQEWIAVGLKASLEIADGVGIQGSAFSAVGGHNVPKAPLIGLGMHFSF